MPRQPTASEVLTLAADKLEQHGLAQGVTIDRQERLCAEEAICRATHQLGGTVELAGEATALVIEHIRRGTGENFTRLRRWNDYPTRTRADVVRALRAAAATPATALPASVTEPTADPVRVVAADVVALADVVDRHAEQMNALLNRFTEALAGTVHELRDDIAAVDTKVDELGTGVAAALAAQAARIDQLEQMLGRRTADDAEAWLRDTVNGAS